MMDMPVITVQSKEFKLFPSGDLLQQTHCILRCTTGAVHADIHIDEVSKRHRIGTGRFFQNLGMNGIPHLHGGGTGDLLVPVTVWVPTKLGQEEKRLLGELGKSPRVTPPAADKM